MRQRFDGQIASVGTTSGTRVVVGHWPRSPHGPFADVMIEDADGHRLLISPTQELADFVSRIYSFDEIAVEPVRVDVTDREWRVDAPRVEVAFTLDGRTPLGRVLRSVPRPLATAPAWTVLTDPVARLALRGVRTRGHGPNGGRRWYGAHDEHAVDSLRRARVDDLDLGELAALDPPVRFGFGPTPRRPSVVSIVSVVEL